MTALPEFIYQGSVKDIRGVRGESPYVFEFSDRYSIFDWGVMPDQLHKKGESLAFMAWFFFDYLGNAKNWKNWEAPKGFAKSSTLERFQGGGVPHHMLALVSHDLKPVSHEREVVTPTRCLTVEPVEVTPPTATQKRGKLVWDYTHYQSKPENALVPLEVIFRFGVPEGSSLLKRTGDAEYCKAIGLKSAPKPGDRFDTPVIEMSTKLEESGDRYISYDEAAKIAGLSAKELAALKDTAALVALRLKDLFADLGIELWDGKFEFAFTQADEKGNRGFMLVDSIGPDELRLIYDGVHLSKEVLRGFYRPTAWHDNIAVAKKQAEERGEKDWKHICIEEMKSYPPVLAPTVKERVEMMYMGLCKALSAKHCTQPIFADAWDLDRVANAFKKKEAA
ncbi:MAG: hypothetical protein OXT65_03585 [Alphaproteobacteria bacterium]|nr:hypothetical protein [Alphaproteobacteria bacterium]